MPRVACGFCGLPFSVRSTGAGVTHYCCSGCALASRIPLAEGALPISTGLVVALVLGFGLFNQLLFAALGLAVAGEGRPEAGLRLCLVSVGVGLLLVAAVVGLTILSRARRWSDGVVLAGALLAAGWGAPAVAGGRLPAVLAPLAANLGLAAWLARGWARRAWAVGKKA